MDDEAANKNSIQITRHDEKISQLTSVNNIHDARLSKLENFKHRSDKYLHTTILIGGFVALSGLGAYGLSFFAAQQATTAIKNADIAQTNINETIRVSLESVTRINSTANLYTFQTGMIIPTFSSSPPDGWLLCDGQTPHEIEQYPNLFDLLHDSVPTTTSTFRTPNLSGRFLRGASNGNPAGDIVAAQVGSHSHPMFGNKSSTSKPLSPDKHEHAAYNSGKHNDENYEIKISPSTPTDKLRGKTYDNVSEGNWPDHVTVYFIIKHDTPQPNEQSTESD